MIFNRTSVLIIFAATFFAAGILFVFASDESEIDVQPGIDGLRFTVHSNDVVLAWPSDPRECFVVLWRSNVTYQSPWIILTNQFHAPAKDGTTFFNDTEALTRSPVMRTNTNLAGFYCVLVIPDFWFNMTGTILSGGPKNTGEDFLPFYFGTAKTDFLQPGVGLFVDGQDQNIGAGQGEKTDCERINFGTPERPLWLNTPGLWFRHDRLANGVHALQLRSSINLNYFMGEWTQTVTVSNQPVQLLITNQITFTNWDDLIWNNTNCTFKAQSTEPQVNWRIKVYDSSGRFLTEKTGRTTNGDIQWTWDLRDQSGQVHDNSDADMVFFSNIKIWPLNKPEDNGDNVLESNAWWDERLGHEFARKHSLFNRKPTPAVETNLPGQCAPTRPLGLSNALADPTLP